MSSHSLIKSFYNIYYMLTISQALARIGDKITYEENIFPAYIEFT